MHRRLIDFISDTEERITIFKDRVHVINYTKILSLEDERISFLTKEKRFVIKGKNLVVIRLLEDEMLIKGEIMGIEVSSV